VKARARSNRQALPRIGAQISTAGGFAPVPERALAMGAEAIQIFNTNPRAWRPQTRSSAELESFVSQTQAHDLPAFCHAIYLINLASPWDEMWERSTDALAQALATGALIRAKAVVTHIGSHQGTGLKAATIRIANGVSRGFEIAKHLIKQPQPRATLPSLLLENGTGSGNTVGGSLNELAQLLADLPESCGACLDTAHLFAAGYPIHVPGGLDEIIDELRRLLLFDRIGLIHLNDSRTPFAAKRDQHENLGQGHIGLEALATVVRHPALRHIPFVLEVPGIEGHGPDATMVALAKSLRAPGSKPAAGPEQGLPGAPGT